MKMDQIAYYCATHEQADRVKRQFGLHNATWAKDTVTANGGAAWTNMVVAPVPVPPLLSVAVRTTL